MFQKYLQVLRCRSGDEKAKRAGEAEDAEAGGGEEEGGAGGWKRTFSKKTFKSLEDNSNNKTKSKKI